MAMPSSPIRTLAICATGVLSGGLFTFLLHYLFREGGVYKQAVFESYPTDFAWDTIALYSLFGALFGLWYAVLLLRKPERWWLPLVITVIPCGTCGACVVSTERGGVDQLGTFTYVLLLAAIMGVTSLAKWIFDRG